MPSTCMEDVHFINYDSKKQIQATADMLIIEALTSVLSTQTIIRSNCGNVLFRWHIVTIVLQHSLFPIQ